MIETFLFLISEPLLAHCGSHGGPFGPNADIAPLLLKPLIVGLLLTSYRINFIRSFSWWFLISSVLIFGVFFFLYVQMAGMVSPQIRPLVFLCLAILQIASETYLLKVLIQRLGADEESNRKWKILTCPTSISLVSNVVTYALWFSIILYY